MLRLTTAISANSQPPPVAIPQRRLIHKPSMTLKGKTSTTSSPSKAEYRRCCFDFSKEKDTLTEQLNQAQEKYQDLKAELIKKEKLLKEERKYNIENLSVIYDLQATEINYETLTLTQPNEKAIEYL